MTACVLENVPVEEIQTNEQVREVDVKDAKTLALAASVKAHGIKQPLGGYRENGVMKLVWGHRRWTAAIIAQLRVVPVLVFDRVPTRSEALRAQLAENLNRVDMNAIDEAKGLERLIKETGETLGSIAEEYGFSEAGLSKKLKLLTLPEQIQGAIKAGRLPASAGYELTLVVDPAEQFRLAKEVVEGRVSRDALRGQIKRTSRPAGARSKSGSSVRVTLPIEHGSSLSWASHDRSLDCLIDQLQDLLGKARKARTKGWEFDTFVRALRDQAKEAS
ncbi:ParB/RepB/Spo0J family partition protein [bacterium]|nr:ParB/RepB/Spo0J family partition protein [bacterium]